MAKTRGVFEKVPGSGVWWIQYKHRPGVYDCGRDGCKGRHRERVGSQSNAVKLYQKRRTQIMSGEKLPELRRRRTTFAELIDIAVQFAEHNHKHPRDIVTKANLVRVDLGHLPAETLTAAAIDAWIAKRRVSPATQNRYKAFFSLCFREGIHREKISTNPARQVRHKREPEGRKRFLSMEEYHQLLEQCPNEAKRRQVIVSILTGMRNSEQDKLEWTDVDLERDEINLRNTKNGTDRTIPMVAEVREILLQLRGEATGGRKRGRVFPRPRGGVGQVEMGWFEKVVARAGIHDYTWHNNRHTFCSWYMMAGGELLELKKIAGHKTLSMTARYAHLAPNQMKTGMARLGKMVDQGRARIIEWPSATKSASR